jgi:hypothetical protein
MLLSGKIDLVSWVILSNEQPIIVISEEGKALLE